MLILYFEVGLQVHFFDVRNAKEPGGHRQRRDMAKKSSGKQRIEEEAEKLAASIAEKHGVRIYDVEYVKEGPEYYLNIYIDKDGGVGILDCEAVSRELSDRLDEEDLIREAYTLVVSSPGLGRALTKDRHLQNSIGEKVEGKLYKSDPRSAAKISKES